MSEEEALYQEVFLLAHRLHWSRHDILELPISERRRYLRLLEEQMRREQEAVARASK